MSTDKAQQIADLIVDHRMIEKQIHDLRIIQLQPLLQTEIEIKNKIAQLQCPYNEKDRITNGKETYEIVTITYGWSYKGYKILGYKIKKDGTPGTQLRELWKINEKWHKVEQPQQTKGEKT